MKRPVPRGFAPVPTFIRIWFWVVFACALLLSGSLFVLAIGSPESFGRYLGLIVKGFGEGIR